MDSSSLMGFALAVAFLAPAIALQQWDEATAKALGQALLDSYHACHLTVQQACASMNIDESKHGKQLRGERGYHLSLTRLMALPVDVQLDFWPRVLGLIGQRHARGVLNDLQLRQSA